MNLQDPMRRTERLIEESAGDDVVIYDRDTDRVTALGAVDARLWRACDGTRTVADLATLADLSETEATAALVRLEEAGLMTSAGMSRRSMLTKAGLVGAGVGAVGLASVVAPVAAHAASVNVPNAGAKTGVVVSSPIISLNGTSADINLKNGVAIVPGVIGTGFGSSTNVTVNLTVSNGKTTSTKAVQVLTTDDGSFYVAGVQIPNVSPGATLNVIASTVGGKTSAPLNTVIGKANGLLGKI